MSDKPVSDRLIELTHPVYTLRFQAPLVYILHADPHDLWHALLALDAVQIPRRGVIHQADAEYKILAFPDGEVVVVDGLGERRGEHAGNVRPDDGAILCGRYAGD